jgi:hypothetical protein
MEWGGEEYDSPVYFSHYRIEAADDRDEIRHKAALRAGAEGVE